jgi:hypothetical protein
MSPVDSKSLSYSYAFWRSQRRWRPPTLRRLRMGRTARRAHQAPSQRHGPVGCRRVFCRLPSWPPWGFAWPELYFEWIRATLLPGTLHNWHCATRKSGYLWGDADDWLSCSNAVAWLHCGQHNQFLSWLDITCIIPKTVPSPR